MSSKALRLTREAGPQGEIGYEYDDAGRRTVLAVTGLPSVIYAYDDADRLTQISRAGVTAGFAYDDADRRTSVTLPNGVVGIYSYDDADQLLSMLYAREGTSIEGVTYTYDAAGRRVGQAGSLAKLIMPPTVTTSYYNAANQLTDWGADSLTYDKNGRLQTFGSTTYGWNSRDQLTSVSRGAGNFAYDFLDRRAMRTVAGVTHSYLYDGLNPVIVNDEFRLNGPGLDEIHAQVSASGITSHLHDGLGSTRVLTDEAGSVTASYSYSPYGLTSETGSADTAVKFTGRDYDDGTGLYYYRARYYSPEFNRFISEDPIGLWGGMNPYAYVSGDPVSYSDPLGLVELLRINDVSFDAYPKGDGTNETARHGPHGEYHFHLNGDSRKVVNAYTLEPENPDVLTKKEKDILKRLTDKQKQFLKTACREVFHNNIQVVGKLRGRLLGKALGPFGAFSSNTHTETCAVDVENETAACGNYE